MSTQKFVIEYDSEKPLLPVNHFRFDTYPGCEKANLELLEGLLKIITDTLILTPIEDGVSRIVNHSKPPSCDVLTIISQEYTSMHENRTAFAGRAGCQ